MSFMMAKGRQGFSMYAEPRMEATITNDTEW